MDIVVRGRHTDVNERFRRHVEGKLSKIGRLDHKVMRVDVEVSEDASLRVPDERERVELTIRARGPVVRAEAAAEDRYAALDLALDKLEGRLRRDAERRKAHHVRARGRAARPADAELPDALRPAGTAGAAATLVAPVETLDPAGTTAATTPAADADEQFVPFEMDGDGPVVVREKTHRAVPMGIEQAVYEMELVGHDFFIFHDKDAGLPSVVYRRRGWDYGVIRLAEE
ncbi:ribosome hibernation-promoting factor, HPF/YfiA family [Actinomadura atramentaria]|uniref:ribosome hibernation-promoting factor, HPF/YfiA family n=1 Tax=Actinomadura atramentaria TaxID=1990 RepID=UPI000381E748|nr:ribosome-associated translation inhibitor RaiA [Actinomadura atramentaria]